MSNLLELNREIKKREVLLRDGVKKIPSNQFQSFIRCLRKVNTSSNRKYSMNVITIPTQIVNLLKLQGGDFIEVGIRKVTQETVKEYTNNKVFYRGDNIYLKRFREHNNG